MQRLFEGKIFEVILFIKPSSVNLSHLLSEVLKLQVGFV